MNWLSQMLTGKDNATQDIGRWSWMVSLLAVVGTAAANLVHGVAVDLVQLATALGAVAGAHGVSIMAKKDTEPGHPPEADK